MELSDIVIAVAALYAAYKVGQYSVILPIARALQEDQESDSQPEQLKSMRIERHAEGYFAYSEAGDYMANGRDFDELFKNFISRFPRGGFQVLKNPEFTDTERDQMVQSLSQHLKDVK